MGTSAAPLSSRFFQVKNVSPAVRKTEEMTFVRLFDGEVSLDGEVNEGGGDIAHGGFVVHQRAALAGSELVGRLVLHGDGVAFGIAAAGPPEPEHHEERHDGDEERPITAQEKHNPGGGARRVHETLVPADHGGEALVKCEGASGLNLDGVAINLDARILRARPENSGVGDGVEAGGTEGQFDMGACGVDGNGPLIAGDVPVELVVVLVKKYRVEEAITEHDGARGVLRVGEEDFEFDVAALTGLLELEGLVVVVGDGNRFEKKSVIQALRCGVFDRDGAKATLIGALEAELHNFGDFDGAVGVDGYLFIEILEGVLAGGGWERGEQREQREYENNTRTARDGDAANHD